MKKNQMQILEKVQYINEKKVWMVTTEYWILPKKVGGGGR